MLETECWPFLDVFLFLVTHICCCLFSTNWEHCRCFDGVGVRSHFRHFQTNGCVQSCFWTFQKVARWMASMNATGMSQIIISNHSMLIIQIWNVKFTFQMFRWRTFLSSYIHFFFTRLNAESIELELFYSIIHTNHTITSIQISIHIWIVKIHTFGNINLLQIALPWLSDGIKPECDRWKLSHCHIFEWNEFNFK